MRKTFRTCCEILFLAFLIPGCQQDKAALLTKLSPEHSGVHFENTIDESPELNILTYEYTYNGGGVAAGDFDNDGWCDLYFSGNTVPNRLYLNQHDLTFKDVTESAGVGGRPLWKTGVTAADVNGDGWLDLYVCYSGPDTSPARSNELYINNGTGKGGQVTFSEKAKEYGLDAPGTFSTQASFFDYDRDGDLDMLLINHASHFFSPFVNTYALRHTRNTEFGNRLYRNDSKGEVHRFTDVSVSAGIDGGGINFGLGVSISDVNNDGWPDIYVTNDYEEQDFLYLNMRDGRFSDITKTSLAHLSRNGMGTDIADFNNDGRADLIEVDMWPEDNYRQKLLKGPDDHNRYNLMVDSGFHYQQMRNTLQLNAGNRSDGTPVFSEIGQMAGVSSTDWSWAPLFVDLDNDGLKDLFVTNGYLRDFTSMDFLKYTVEEARKKAQTSGQEFQVYDLVSKMPSTKTRDYIFRNNGDFSFADYSEQWGMSEPNLCFGATYADLDNDGDVELITNNTNETACIWINHSDRVANNHYVSVRLLGPLMNPYAVGAKVKVSSRKSVQMLEQFPTRGFQSSVDPVLHFGLGADSLVDVMVTWPDGKESLMPGISCNHLTTISYESAISAGATVAVGTPTLFVDATDRSGIDFVHRENKFVDFNREPLIPYQLSRLGPALAVGDVNRDGKDDFYVGGAAGQPGRLYVADKIGHYRFLSGQPWETDAASEDTGAVFLDIDGDGDQDLFVVSGGNEFPDRSELLNDRLYVNNGQGSFSKAKAGSIPEDQSNGSCVVAADYDQDGDIDLYVGGRGVPGSFPVASRGALLRNESSHSTHEIKLIDATRDVNADLREPGMVTDAMWTDYNGDGWSDLILVGDWMAIRLFRNDKGTLVELKSTGLSNTTGLWKRIQSADLDGDGDLDYVVGNAGLNIPWTVSPHEPLQLYFGDYNTDGHIDPIMCYTQNNRQFPVASRDELLNQLNTLRKKFTSYSQYAKASIEDILDEGQIRRSRKLNVMMTESIILKNLGGGNFTVQVLPRLAQASSANGIVLHDFNHDKVVDVLLAGNFYPFRTQYGRCDAGLGLLLTSDGKFGFTPLQWSQSGFYAPGDVRNMLALNGKSTTKFVVVARNDDKVSLIRFEDK